MCCSSGSSAHEKFSVFPAQHRAPTRAPPPPLSPFRPHRHRAKRRSERTPPPPAVPAASTERCGARALPAARCPLPAVTPPKRIWMKVTRAPSSRREAAAAARGQPAPLSALGRGLLRDRHCSGGASAGPFPLLSSPAAASPAVLSSADGGRFPDRHLPCGGGAGRPGGPSARGAGPLRSGAALHGGTAASAVWGAAVPNRSSPGSAGGRQGSTNVGMWGLVQPLCFAEIVLLRRGGTSLGKLSISVSISLNPGRP